ncbi:MAG: biotin--[acetyl-CoA-carboxylase] ligase [Endomicrobia bacterium]|nr:biotin--[acetyl-CoA-carboxylase] ligase [Endomicrobiia bacterium]
MKIVEILSGNKYISGNEIGRLLGISRAAVHKQIKNMRNSGFIVESSAKGYRLVKKVPVFSREEVFKNIPHSLSVCKKIIHLKKINSTQIKLKNLADDNEPEGAVIVADEQNAGYGRMRRGWSSAAGGLWFSMLLKPKIAPERASLTALLIGIALNRVLKKEYGVKTKIKWPNDILFDCKKLAGIIIEMSAEQDAVNWIVAGVGVNADNILPKDLKDAVSLSAILDKAADRAKLLAFFLSEFDGIYAEFQNSGFGGFAGEYNENIAFLNENVTIDSGFDIIKGLNKGISEDGRLVIETNNGFEKIISGTLRRSS